ncbi:hypothetical protein RUM44_008312 [Polyplax serrata]|uniref:Uncharacterized protein n=1 Tax=Polyplax serrata TaxID=468196 RepID=A0ABR1B9Z7_POLSC
MNGEVLSGISFFPYSSLGFGLSSTELQITLFLNWFIVLLRPDKSFEVHALLTPLRDSAIFPQGKLSQRGGGKPRMGTINGDMYGIKFQYHPLAA